jgi:hypothetical protein
MRTPAANQLVVTTTTPTYSQPIPTGGQNGIALDFTVVSSNIGATSTSVSASIEQSSDLQNWSVVALTATFTGTSGQLPAYTSVMTTATGSALSAGYVRVAFTVGASTTRACVAAGVNFFNFST